MRIRVGLVAVRGGAEVAPYMGIGKLWGAAAMVEQFSRFALRLHSGLRQQGRLLRSWLVFGIHSTSLRTGSEAVPLRETYADGEGFWWGGEGCTRALPVWGGALALGLPWRPANPHLKSKARCGAHAVWLVQTLATCPAYANLKGYPPLIVLN
jgi:hypothetical protein